MDNGIGITTVIGKHVIGDHRVRLERGGGGGVGAQSGGGVDVCAVRVESELVHLSQTSANVERGCSIVRVESEDWVGERGEQGISRDGMRRAINIYNAD